METTPFVIILIVSLVITYIIVKFAGPKKCPYQEAFTVPELNSCPYGTTQYVSSDEQKLCCDGKVDGKTCLGKDICRFTTSNDPKAVPLCGNYVKAQMFNVKGSLIQNPDTDMCLASHGKNTVFAKKCSTTDTNQLWTYNELGQLQHDKTKLCMTEVVDPRTSFIKYHVLGKCGLNDSQKYTYDFKTNTIGVKSSPGKSLFVQNFYGGDQKIILTQMTDDEIKSAHKKNTGKEIDKKSLDDLKNAFYSNSKRTTLIGMRPTVKESISIVQNLFKPTSAAK